MLAIVGCSVVVLTGWSGQVSLGQMSFAAVGATVGAVALVDWHWDLSLTLLLAGAAAGVVAVVVGIPTLRLDGMFAAVTTLAFSLAASGYLLVREEFSWIPQGQLGTPYLFGIAITSQSAVFELCLGVLVLVLIALHGLRHSRTGRVLRALPANQRAAAGYGVRVDVGEAHRLRRLGLHRRTGRVPSPGGEPAVRGDVVPGPGEPDRLHLHGRRWAGLGLGRHPRRRHRRGQCGVPAAELAALSRPHSACSWSSSSSLVGWPASATTCATGPSRGWPGARGDRGAGVARPDRRGAGAVNRLVKLAGGASLFPLGSALHD